MDFPEPVISMSIEPNTNEDKKKLSEALTTIRREDPSFQTNYNEETGQTIIAGMGELHLEVLVDRMLREFKVEANVGKPQVAYRETITKSVPEYTYTHKKQTGGSGQYGRVAGFFEPNEEADFEFVDNIVGGVIPREFISSCQKGFKSMMDKGQLIGSPIVNVRVTINDGAAHAVDSSDVAFQEAARGAWRTNYNNASPAILEPIMKVEIEGPVEFHGNIVATVMQRRGIIMGSEESDGYSRVEAEVPLSEMFGYATVLRSSTQGKAEFSMEFSKYEQVPKGIAEDLMKKYQEERAAQSKK